jgi:beta-glucosidase
MKLKNKIVKIFVWGIIILLIVFVLPLPKTKKQETPAYNVADLKFPKGFFWGTATAAHQVEGNTNNQLTQWEKDNAKRLASEAESKLKNLPDWEAIKTQATDPANYISGTADDEYNRYPEDIKLMKQIGVNSYRFSIEWSRIEPEKDKFDSKEIEHYRAEIQALKAAGIEPFVTLWHRSEPTWILSQGEWESPQTIADYKKYVEYVVSNLGSEVKYWMTFNEPIVHEAAAYIRGDIPPQVKSLTRAKTVLKNMIEANNQAYQIIHQKDSEAVVGSTQAMLSLYGLPSTIANKIAARYLDSAGNQSFLDGTKDNMDFIGVQYYGSNAIAVKFDKSTLIGIKNFSDPQQIQSEVGTEINPAALYSILKSTYQRYKKPIIITENGIADRDDNQRTQYITDHLYWVKKAIDDGVPIEGYFYWSLLDNFEWNSGYWPKFGLISVDRVTQKRTIRPSALDYQKIIEQTQK